MPSYNAVDFLKNLAKTVNALSDKVAEFQHLPASTLSKQPSPERWSVLQVLEHLNGYDLYYLLHIEQALKNAAGNRLKPSGVFKPGILGRYFTKMMQPGANGGITNKMKAFKAHIPAAVLDKELVLKEFNEHQKHLEQLLHIASKSNLNQIRIPISISSLIKLKLGDTFNFLIAHKQRHMVQIVNVLRDLKVDIPNLMKQV